MVNFSFNFIPIINAFIYNAVIKGNKWNTKKMVSYKEMLKIIATNYPIESIERLQDDPNDVKLNNLIKIL
jgi:hypothetical protein